MLDHEVLERYRAVAVINDEPKQWCIRRNRGRKFYAEDQPLQSHHLRSMLLHEYWIATRAPVIPIIDRISIDLDCRAKENVAHRTDTYFRLRTVFGVERTPLVYGTPTGCGLRVVYRIPKTPLHEIITGLKTGLVADVLRAAELAPHTGFIEIFPQKTQAERLPLGRRMPILDPDTLRPLPHAAIGDRYCPRMLLGALEEMERWHAHPDPDLLVHLRSLPQQPSYTKGEASSARVHLVIDTGTRKVAPTPALEALVANGLPRPSSRFASEWQVGLAFVSDPARYPEYDLSADATEEDVARAIALWLSEKHNGVSEEWTLSVGKRGSVSGAIVHWMEQYLTRSSAGDHMIDRLQRTVGAVDPRACRVIQLNARERARLLKVANRHYPPGAQRYRFEVWLFCWMRAVKACLLYGTAHGTELPRRRGTHVQVQMSALWMQAWPYGKGTNSKTKQTRYAEYRHILESEGLMTWAAPYLNPACWRSQLEDHYPGVATRYTVRLPELNTSLVDVPVAPWTLGAAIAQVPGAYGRSLTPDEAYHALEVTAGGMDLKKRYGAHVAKQVTALARAIRASLAGAEERRTMRPAAEDPGDVAHPLAA